MSILGALSLCRCVSSKQRFLGMTKHVLVKEFRAHVKSYNGVYLTDPRPLRSFQLRSF